MSDPFFPELASDPGEDAARGAEARRPRGFVIRTDGAARGNPGPASLGAALFDLSRADARDDRAVPDASISDYLGIQTNNVAEYTGVVRALDLARDLGAREVHLLLDSKLIVEQLAGRWRVKDAKLIPLWSAARATLGGFDRWSATHVPRALNTVADRWPTRPSTGSRRAARHRSSVDRATEPARRPGPSGAPRVGWSGQRGGRMAARRRWGDPSGGVRKVRAPQRRVAGNARPP